MLDTAGSVCKPGQLVGVWCIACRLVLCKCWLDTACKKMGCMPGRQRHFACEAQSVWRLMLDVSAGLLQLLLFR
jgi:hypothetical protein